MIDIMGEKEDEPLPQQSVDGADSDEWSDWIIIKTVTT